MTNVPGSPQPDVKALEAELARLRRKVAELERRIEVLEP